MSRVGVSDNGARITGGGEGAVLFIIRVDCQLLKRLVFAAREVFADEGHHAARATDGHASAGTALDHEETRFTVRVVQCRVTQLVVRGNALKWQKAVKRVFEGEGTPPAAGQFSDELSE